MDSFENTTDFLKSRQLISAGSLEAGGLLPGFSSKEEWYYGRVHEIVSGQPYSWLRQFLILNDTARVAGVFSDQCELYPMAFQQVGVDSRRVLVVDQVKDFNELEFAVNTLLNSRTVSVVICDLKRVPVFSIDRFLRRIQVLSKNVSVGIFLWSKEPISSYVIQHRILWEGESSSTLKKKGGDTSALSGHSVLGGGHE